MQIMGERIEEIKRILFKAFPKLLQDNRFKVTSKATPNYNCIAWACKYDERWIQPPYMGKPNLDCVVWWPPDIPEGLEPECLKKLFEYHGYAECKSSKREEGYRKVAIFFNEQTNEWTHAARELNNGCWTSKLGQFADIQHGTPEAIENDDYGKVYCFMKKKLE
jgi:hypothetical protein